MGLLWNDFLCDKKLISYEILGKKGVAEFFK